MTTLPLLREISLTSVQIEPHPYAVVSEAEVDRLRKSLAEVGLLSPPWVKTGPRGRLLPVLGWRRLTAAARLGWPAIPAFVLNPKTPESHGLLLYLHDNAFSRALSPLEQALLAARLLVHWDRDTVIVKGLPLLGLPPTPAHLDRLLAAAGLEPPWRELLGRGRLALTAAARLAAFTPPDRKAALAFLAALPFSQSKQEEFLDGVEILARRQGVAVAAFLQDQELQNLLNDPALNPPERTEALRRLLKERLSPRFSAAKRAFTAGLERLGLRRHPRLRLAEPPAFEGPDLELTVKFRDSAELRELLQDLSRLARLPDFEALVDLKG